MIKKNLKDVEWTLISEIFPNGVHMPNADDTVQRINSESNFDHYKKNIINRFGDSDVIIDKDAEVYNNFKIVNAEFERVLNIFMDSKRRYYNI